MFGNSHALWGEGIALHQCAPQFEALGMESEFFVFSGSKMWKDFFYKIWIPVCECPLNTKLSLIGHNNHFVLLHVSI